MRLLIITRSFPPRNSARALQVGKVAEAIADAGVNVLVLAGSDSLKSSEQCTSRNCSVIYIPYHRPHGGKILQGLWEQLNSVNFLNPWVRQTVAKAQSLIEDFKPDCFLTSSMPFQTHLVGLAVKRFSGLPWIASFSDPWPNCFSPKPYCRRGVPVISALEKRLFRLVTRRCDAIHMPSRHGIDWVEKVSGVSITNKALAIPHIGNSSPSGENSRSYGGWLAHVGHLSRERVSKALLTAIQEVHQRIPNHFEGLLCVGNVCAEFKELVREMGLEQIVKLTGQIPAKDATQIACSATALLVIEADMPMSPFLPSKFADYALAGKPILAITPAVGAIHDYLKNCTGGRHACHDPQAIRDALMELFSNEGVNVVVSERDDGNLAQNFHSSTVGRLYKSALEEIVCNGAHKSNRGLSTSVND